jgi:hypothetical protein
MQKDPKNYFQEHERVLNTYRHLTILPKASVKLVLSLTSFLTSVAHIYPSDYPALFLSYLSSVKNQSLEKSLLRNVFILKHKKLIDDVTFLKVLLDMSDLSQNVGEKCREILEPKDLIPLLSKYIEVGTDKQSTFSMFAICYIYEIKAIDEVESLIVENLFVNSKLSKICLLYFLGEIDFVKGDESRILCNVKSERAIIISKKILKDVVDRKEERSHKIKQLKLVSALKCKHGLKIDFSNVVMKFINPSKDDLKPLMLILLDSLNEYKEDLNRKIIDMFCSEYRDDDFVVYGLNFLKEMVKRYGEGERVLESVEAFKRNKVKCISSAYTSLRKLVKKDIYDGRDIDYIKGQRGRDGREDGNNKKKRVKRQKG